MSIIKVNVLAFTLLKYYALLITTNAPSVVRRSNSTQLIRDRQ